MRWNQLGRTDLKVPDICLGTMTWGSQNTPEEAHAQIDLSLEHGVNFLDTAEMYPTTPIKRDTCGFTEDYIGQWIGKHGRRDELIIATKIVGDGFHNIRDGGPITPGVIPQALEGSLKRLRTDYVDLYQLHWPNRGSMHFRKNWTFAPYATQEKGAIEDDIRRVLEALAKEVEAGRIRHIGLSNESAYGVLSFIKVAEEFGLPRVVSTQNEYSLMYRHHDLDLAEVSLHEDVGLLSYSPLAAGLLGGRYRGGVIPDGSRGSINANLHGRMTETAHQAVEAYAELASDLGMTVAQLAITFCREQPFMTTTIIGASQQAQLEEIMAGKDFTLTDDAKAEILRLHKAFPMPF